MGDAIVTGLPTIDYTGRDFDTIKELLKVHLQTKFPNTWKNFYESAEGMSWLELVAYSYTILSFYLDYQANECVVGDTLVSTVDGREVPVRQLAREAAFWVYSWDAEQQKIRPGLAKAYLRRKNAKLCRVRLDNNTYVDCTPDHLFLLRSGEYKEAQYLVPGDSLMALYRNQGYESIRNPITGEWSYTHQQFCPGPRPQGKHIVHHVDGDSRNNVPGNLAAKTVGQHLSGHLADDPMRRYRCGNAFRGKKRPDHAEKMQGNSHALGTRHSADTKARIASKLTGIPKTSEHRAKISKALRGKPKSPEHRENLAAANLGKRLTEKHRVGISEGLQRHYRHAVNHKVVGVYKLRRREDVYDLSVEKYHNFALTCGVFVHNCYLPTQQDRENTVKICKLIGYRLQAPRAASVECLLELGAIQLVDVVIASGTKITTINGLTFEFISGAIVPAGAQTATAIVTQGEADQDVFSSDGTNFQRFLLTGTPVVDDSISVSIDGTDWTETEALVYGDGTSEIFQVVYDVDSDNNDIAYIEFGDGTSGKVPPAGAVISGTYRVGGGIEGNIALSQINQQAAGVLDGVVPVTTVNVTVSNPEERGSGGEDRETIQHAKYWAPQWVKTNGRAVTEADFDVLATRFSDPTYGGVAYAKATLRQEIPELNTVDVYVWSRDQSGVPAPPSSGLTSAIQDYFDNNSAGAVRVICTDTVVQDGVNLWLDISVQYASLTQYKDVDVEAAIQTAISDLFESQLIQAGKDFKLSYLYSAVQNAEGVDYAIIVWIKAGIKQETNIGTGDDATTAFSGTVANTPVIENTVLIQAGVQTVTDDGDGNLTGNGTGTVDYDTGVASVTWGLPPNLGENVVVTSRYLKQYQRGAAEEVVTTPAARWRGRISNPPVVPSSFALSDGSQVIYDDGAGNLVGDIDPYGKNTIDYTTGSYDATFASSVVTGLTISSTYRQYLSVNSGNIPAEKWELSVLGNQFMAKVG